MRRASLRSGSVLILANRIKAARLQKGWHTPREMAAATGISHPSIWRAESGKEPSLTNAMRIAAALEYPVEELWELEGVGASRSDSGAAAKG